LTLSVPATNHEISAPFTKPEPELMGCPVFIPYTFEWAVEEGRSNQNPICRNDHFSLFVACGCGAHLSEV